MANSVDPIQHDGASTVSSMGSKAVKYGLLAGAAAFIVPLAFTAVAAVAVVGAVAGVGGIAGTVALGIGAVLSGFAAVSTYGYAGIATVVGGGLGALKGADQVSRESSSFRSRVASQMRGDENKEMKTFNDGEISGLEKGYRTATQDMEAQMAAREQAAFEKGQEVVVKQIQEQMMKAAQAEQAAAQAAAPAAPAHAEKHVAKHEHKEHEHKEHEHKDAAKAAVQIGNKVIASREGADGSKATAIVEQRAAAADAGHNVSV